MWTSDVSSDTESENAARSAQVPANGRKQPKPGSGVLARRASFGSASQRAHSHAKAVSPKRVADEAGSAKAEAAKAEAAKAEAAKADSASARLLDIVCHFRHRRKPDVAPGLDVRDQAIG